MTALNRLTKTAVGKRIEIATKVKSRPIRGVIKDVQVASSHTAVLVESGFGSSKWHTLTDDAEISIYS